MGCAYFGIRFVTAAQQCWTIFERWTFAIRVLLVMQHAFQGINTWYNVGRTWNYQRSINLASHSSKQVGESGVFSPSLLSQGVSHYTTRISRLPTRYTLPCSVVMRLGLKWGVEIAACENENVSEPFRSNVVSISIQISVCWYILQIRWIQSSRQAGRQTDRQTDRYTSFIVS